MNGNREAVPLPTVIGRNVRLLRQRAGLTTDGLAGVMRVRSGLQGQASTVRKIESGSGSPTLPSLLMLADALGSVLEGGVSLRDLTHGVSENELIALNQNYALTSGELDALLLDQPVTLPGAYRRGVFARQDEFARDRDQLGIPKGAVSLSKVIEIERASGEAEARAARDVGVSPGQFATLSAALWRTTFTEERNRRAGPDANAQKRGRISRELKAEARKALPHGDD